MKFLPYRLASGKTNVVAFQMAVGASPRTGIADVAALANHLSSGTHLLIHFSWYGRYAVGHRLAELQSRINDRCIFHLMANTPEEADKFLKTGLPVLHAPASIYVSEHTFRIRPKVPKRYDAIYIANFRPGERDGFKRTYLACKLPSLRIITYPAGGEIPNGVFKTEFLRTFPELAHAEVNDSYLGPQEVARALSAATTHLALSEVEGCMYAFTEGLLCGLPAISTRCKGGREQFFHPSYVQLVEPDPDEIAAAVQRGTNRTHHPEAIRNFALGRLHEFRKRYVDYISRLTGQSSDTLYTNIFGPPNGVDRLCFNFPGASVQEIG